MKKNLLVAGSILLAGSAFAQNDTLLWDNFETDPSTYMQWQIAPPGSTTDANWYNVDNDGLPDGSTQGTRPGEWFWSLGFATVDSTNSVLAANSWTNDANTPVDNVLISPRIDIIDGTAMLSWKSATFQTPRYLDGYVVLVSTTDNNFASFTDTLFVASEYEAVGSNPDDYATYTFAPAATANPLAPFVHGMDNTYTENDSADLSRRRGVLRPFSVSLAQYNGQHIFIQFKHNSHDDNLISIDEILVMGTDPNSVEDNSNIVNFGLYPNPANEIVNVNYDLAVASEVTVRILDVNGREVFVQNEGTVQNGRVAVNTSNLAAGMYMVQLVAGNTVTTERLIVE
jgi:hypothetical protein